MCKGDTMKDWFTVEKIDEKTFAISEYNHTQEPHSYLLIGDKKAILIDSGLGVSNIKNVVDKLTDLDVDLVSTHFHWDHIGGHNNFENYYIHKDEVDLVMNNPMFNLSCIKNNLMRGIEEFPEDFDIEKYEMFQKKPKRILNDGDIIDLGNRKIKVIHTPGHSPGHICLYDIERKYLITGDLVYKGILFAFFPTSDPKKYFESLKKIKDLDVVKILPGHHSLNINPEMSKDVYNAFKKIKDNGYLRHGSGSFDFGEFKILL